MMADSLDHPFDPTDRAFTVAEASRVSGVSEFDLRNWMRRGIVTVGAKNRLGRIMFSALDIIYLRVMGDLSQLVGADLTKVTKIAEHVATYCASWMKRENVHLRQTDGGLRRETRLLFNLGDDGKTPSMTVCEWGDSAFGLKVANRGEENPWTRRPFLIVPVEQFFGDVLEELFLILEGEVG